MPRVMSFNGSFQRNWVSTYQLGCHLLLFLCFWIHTQAAATPDPATTSGTCSCRHTTPQKSVQPLKFCNWYYQSSCCLPSHDADIQQKFLTLIEAGETCAKYNNEAKMFLSAAFCYGCDPKEPLHFTPPLNKEFFQAEKSVKICSELAEKIHPDFFMDCGMTLPDDRESVCSPNSAIAPPYVWPDCKDEQYVCIDAESNWYCSSTKCGDDNTPLGFSNMPCSKANYTCQGVLKMLNDNRAAKPPNYEESPVEIIDRQACLESEGSANTSDASRCNCLEIPAYMRSDSFSTTSSSSSSPLIFIVPLFVSILLSYRNVVDFE